MRMVTEITNNPGLKYTLIGATSDGVHFYKEEVNTEFYKRRELLQENINNKQKGIIKKQVEYKLPEVIMEDTFFDVDCMYDVSVDVKYKNIKVTNEDTGEVKIFETFGTPRRVMLSKNVLSYDDFIDETSSHYNYCIDINTEAVIGKRSIESNNGASMSWDSGGPVTVNPGPGPIVTEINWTFTDQGFIDYQYPATDYIKRTYTDPTQQDNSPWLQFNDGLALRLTFEDDINCSFYNPNTQTGTASAIVTTTEDTILNITWTGLGERYDPQEDGFGAFELMELYVDDVYVSSAESPGYRAEGGSEGCVDGKAALAPVISINEPPQNVLLTAGEHTLSIYCTTNDNNYHSSDAYYEFELSFTKPV